MSTEEGRKPLELIVYPHRIANFGPFGKPLIAPHPEQFLTPDGTIIDVRDRPSKRLTDTELSAMYWWALLDAQRYDTVQASHTGSKLPRHRLARVAAERGHKARDRAETIARFIHYPHIGGEDA